MLQISCKCSEVRMDHDQLEYVKECGGQKANEGDQVVEVPRR
jgi:hypothetical protein